MSLPAAREADHSVDMSNTDTKDTPLFPSQTTFDAVVYRNFYGTDEDHDAMPPSAKRARPSAEAPELPQKSALRASRLLDNLGLKLGGSIETTTEPGQATPLDVYLSSEEDASSDADDFSDYGYDSSVEDPTSPTLQQSRSRNSHEDTARVVSVIYSGKPSIIDLTFLRRRSISPNSIETRTRSSTVSSTTRTPLDRPSTPTSSVSSPVQPARKGSLLSDLLVKKRPPPFLSIDPYANGSTYSLDVPKQERIVEDDSPIKVPKTPTQLLKGMSRTFSLVRKRSRPLLRTESPQPQPVQTNFFSANGPSPLSASDPPALSAGPSEADVDVHEVDSPSTPQTPITYNDIMRAAKKNAIMMPPSPMNQTAISPMAPQTAPGPKRGILSGLAARRRSIKLTGRALG